MSLKTLHVVFVISSTLLSLGFGVWSWTHHQNGAGAGYLWAAIAAFLAAIMLVVYGKWFLNKLKDVSFL
ncbi:MAG: hypothetical protein K0U98_22895 [Deltaproteobacteria bacterium]|nr:hypothetical protein [Deltaproteobacteria bacterium]